MSRTASVPGPGACTCPSASVSSAPMVRRLRPLLAILAILAAGTVAGAAVWLLYTQAGLRWAAAQLERSTGGALVLEDARGALFREVLVSRIRYQEGGTVVEARDITLRVSPLSLPTLALRVNAAHVGEFDVVLAPGGEPAHM